MLSFFNLGYRAMHFRFLGTVAVSSELLITFVITGSKLVKHSNKILAGIGSRTQDLWAILFRGDKQIIGSCRYKGSKFTTFHWWW